MNDLQLLKAAHDILVTLREQLKHSNASNAMLTRMDHWVAEYNCASDANDQTNSEPLAVHPYLAKKSMAELYPDYHKAIPEGWTTIDTYRVNQLFPIADDSGMLLHARKKLLVPGCRTGGKSAYDDVKEAVDTLKAWLEENKPVEVKPVSPAWAKGKLLQTQIGVGPEKWYYEIEGSNVFSGYFGESDKAIDHAYKHRVKLTNL